MNNLKITLSQLLLTCFLFIYQNHLFAQTNHVWQQISEEQFDLKGIRYIQPTVYQTYKMDVQQMKVALSKTPFTGTEAVKKQPAFLDLPWPDGTFKTFQIIESPVMEKELMDKYPEIKTYSGSAIDDPSKFIRLDLTPQGFHAMVLTSGEGTVYIDPYSFGGGDIEHYIVYYKKDFIPIAGKHMVCGVDGKAVNTQNFRPPTSGYRFGSCELRTYRLALAATGEYTQFHGGTKALALAAQVTSMNRVNAVYNRDMAIQMNIIANNDLIIYTNGATDPYTNNNGATMLNENQTNINAVIGSANYDIGHVYSTGGGGIAQLYSPCTSNKARGVTGSNAPVNDPFDIDYVCHEIGHQFGANHTQNNSCQRNTSTSMEPGSASTIMGYAGICPPNVQNNSDDHFHGISLEEIGAFITSGGHTCPVKTPLSNSAPTVSGTNAAGVTVPGSTPFALTATASDPDGNTLSYCWEQIDATVSTQPPISTSTGGPNFRSNSPLTSPTRYFPNLPAVVSGTNPTWEVLASVSRTMDFRVTVRDNAAGGGCSDHSDITINIDGGSGPFLVTYPNASGISWSGSSTQTVTWNVAGTDGSPVSCANVDIYLSTDGGSTFPTLLATNVPNDGSQSVTVPNTATTTAMIMVICANGTFFDLSDNTFTITAATFDYTLSTTNSSVNVCAPSNGVYTIDVGSIGGYNDPVNLSLTGNPAGTTVNFGTNPVTPAGSSVLTIGNTFAATAGTYNMTVTANSTAGTKTLSLTLVVSTLPANVSLISPANASTGQVLNPTFNWTAAGGSGITYEIDIATDAGFSSIVQSVTALSANSYVASPALMANTTYYWRVRSVSACGNGNYTSTYSFTTSNLSCITIASSNVPVNISASGTPIITSTLLASLPAGASITSLNVLNLTGQHTYISDLVISLSSPNGTSVNLLNAVCNNENNFDINFSSTGSAYSSIPCPPVDGLTYQPEGNLANFNGEDPSGTWTLTIQDLFNQDGGSLDSWSLEICYQVIPPCNLSVSSSSITDVTCNGGTDGSATVTSANGTAPVVYNWSNGGNTATINNLSAGTYTVTATDANSCTATTSLNVTEPAAMNLAMTVVNESCVGNDGSVSVLVSNGTAPYTYSWSNGGNSNSINNLIIGSYTLTVTDANGCTASNSANVNDGCNTSIGCDTISNIDPSDNLTIYTITNGYVSGHNSYTDLAKADYYNYAGTNTHIQGAFYYFAAAAASNTTNTFNCNVWDGTGGTPGAIIAQTTVTYNALVNAGTPGLFYIPFDYTVLPASGEFFVGIEFAYVVGDTIALVTNTDPETTPATAWEQWSNNVWYSYADGNSWGINVAHDISPVLGTLPTAGFSQNNSILCNSGSVDFTNASSNASSYEWIFPGGNPSSSTASNPTVNYNSAGSYDVTLIATNACMVDTIVISNAVTVSSVNATATGTGVQCNGQTNGQLNATATGGTAAYSYLWSNGSTGSAVNLVGPGNYTVTVTDANGCQATANTTVTEPTLLSLSSTGSSNPSCNGASDGSISVSGNGGTTPYYYETGVLNQSSGTFTGLSAGTYNITVTDANSCQATVVVTLNDPPVLNANTSLNSGISCAGGNDASATASATGGTGSYSYSWNNGQNTAIANGLSAGTYTVTVTDANACTSTSSINITDPSGMSANTTVSSNYNGQDISCNGASDGQASVSVSGGAGGYSYNWSNGQNTMLASGLSAGTYSVTITDGSGCTTVSSVNLSQPTPLNASATASDVQCNGQTNGQLNVSASGGTAAYSYLWSNGSTANTVNLVGPGNYIVTVTDANGCETTGSTNVSEPAQLTSVITDNGNGTATVVVNGGIAPYYYIWDPSTGSQTGATATGLSSGTFYVDITDNNGCTISDTITIVFTSLEEIVDSERFIVYPNPNNGSFIVELEFDQRTKGDLQFTNVLGQELSSIGFFEKSTKIPFDLRRLSPGVYFIHLEVRNKIRTQKLIIKD